MATTVSSRPATTTRFLAECFWPGVHEPDVLDAAGRLARAAVAAARSNPDAAADTACEGWILAPADEVVSFLFRAASADAVMRTCVHADVRAERVIEVVSTIGAPGSTAGGCDAVGAETGGGAGDA